MKELNEIIMKMTTTNFQLKDDEYIKNGLIYCKKCNTQRQYLLTALKEPKLVKCMCKCESEEYQRQEEEKRQMARLEIVNNLRVKSLLGKRYENARFETCEIPNESFKTAMGRCKKYCEVSNDVLDEGDGIYIYGNSGVGKTHLTACMCNELTERMHQCLFTSFIEISKAIRGTFNNKNDSEEDLVERLANVDFLFIDDVGTEILSKNGEDTWLQEKVYDLINKRYNNKKCTIFSSNYSLQELISDRGMMFKTVDRIQQMSKAVIKLEGKSFRRTIQKETLF